MKEGLKVWGLGFLIIFIIVTSLMMFKNCVDEHRQDLGLSTWSAITACG